MLITKYLRHLVWSPQASCTFLPWLHSRNDDLAFSSTFYGMARHTRVHHCLPCHIFKEVIRIFALLLFPVQLPHRKLEGFIDHKSTSCEAHAFFSPFTKSLAFAQTQEWLLSALSTLSSSGYLCSLLVTNDLVLILAPFANPIGFRKYDLTMFLKLQI